MEVGWSVSQNVSKLFIPPPEKVSFVGFFFTPTESCTLSFRRPKNSP